MRIVLLGKNGQVGRALQRSLSALGKVFALSRQAVDLSDLDGLRQCVLEYRPEFIVNAAAYTAVDQAESEPDVAHTTNALATEVLAEVALLQKAWLIHYSTDYVFDGAQPTSYFETNQTNPLNVYGQSKLAGEAAIRQIGCQHLIFRTSWVYSIFGKNFPLAILNRAMSQDRLEVIEDAFGVPTSAELIADVTALAIYRIQQDKAFAARAAGIYHLVSSGKISWYEYAHYLVFKGIQKGFKFELSLDNLIPIPSKSYQTAAKRPQNVLLNNQKISEQFDLVLPDWKIHVDEFLETLVKTRML